MLFLPTPIVPESFLTLSHPFIPTNHLHRSLRLPFGNEVFWRKTGQIDIHPIAFDWQRVCIFATRT